MLAPSSSALKHVLHRLAIQHDSTVGRAIIESFSGPSNNAFKGDISDCLLLLVVSLMRLHHEQVSYLSAQLCSCTRVHHF